MRCLTALLHHQLWIVVLVAGVLEVPARGADETVAKDTAIVQVQLPPGATIEINGKQYGQQKQFTYKPLTSGKTYRIEIKARLRDGRSMARTLLFEGGQRINVPVRVSTSVRPVPVIQTGHSSAVACVAFSSDGTKIATVGEFDNTVIVWDVESGRVLRAFELETAILGAVSFSPDGKKLFVGAMESSLWDLQSGRKLQTFRGHRLVVMSAAYSPDGLTILTGSHDNTGILWDATTGARRTIFRGHTDGVNSVAFSPDGTKVLTGSRDKTAILWDAARGRQLRILRSHGDEVRAVAFGPAGRTIVTGSADKTAITWDARSGHRLQTFPAAAGVNAVALSRDETKLAVGLADNTAVVWHVASGRKSATLRGHISKPGPPVMLGEVRSIAFHPGGTKIVTAATDETAILWDAETGKRLHTFKGYLSQINALACSPDSSTPLFVTGSEDRNLILWDMAAGKPFPPFHIDRAGIQHVSLNSDGSKVSARTFFLNGVTWDVASRSPLFRWPQVQAIHFSPRGDLGLGVGNGVVFLIDLTSGREQRRFERTTCAAFNADGSRIITGTQDGTLAIWDGRGNRRLGQLGTRMGHLTSLRFSQSGNRVLVVADNGVRILDSQNGRTIRSFPSKSFGLPTAAISPNGRKLVLASEKIVTLYDLDSGGVWRRFSGHANRVSSVEFTSDGTKIITGSWDGTTRLWSIATGDELARLITLAGGEDWLAVTPDGLFDGSAGGRQRVSYRVGGGLNVVPVDRFFQDFYYPGILAAIWLGERPTSEVQFGQSVPPTLKIVSPAAGTVETPRVTVQVQALDQGGGVSNLAIHQNGARLLAPGKTRQEGKTIYRSFEVDLVEGENRLEVRAASGDGSWEAEPAVAVIHYGRPLDKSQLHVVAVGVSQYADANLNLKFAADDASGTLTKLFKKRGEALYSRVHTRLLLNEAATKSGIEDALKDVAGKTRPQDTLLLFLAGHGTMIGQRYYFVPHELRKEAERVEEDIRKQGLPADELSDYLGTAKALKRILIFDTCASGGALGRSLTGRSGFALRGAIERLSRTQGVFTIAAAASTEEAQESTELGHGVLSYALLAGLKGVDKGPLAGRYIRTSNPDRVVDVMEWFAFAAGQVPRLTERLYGVGQDVQTSTEGSSFPLLPLSD